MAHEALMLWLRISHFATLSDRFANFAKPMKKTSSDRFSVPQDLSLLPTFNVRQFIDSLAAAHGVTCSRTGLDGFAEAVTRLAGDETKLDMTGKLLVELKKRRILNGRQLARLTTNYLAEITDLQG